MPSIGPFELMAAQVIFYTDKAPAIRLNEEVKAIMLVRDVPDQNTVEKVVGIHLTDADPDAGHITMLRVADAWYVGFSFFYNRSKAGESIASATNYLKLARNALEEGFFRGFVDNLHSATELAARARLMLMPSPQFLKFKKHSHVQAEFNKFGRDLGGRRNVPEPYLKLLNNLDKIRSPAKYSVEPFTLDVLKAQHMLATATEMVQDIARTISLP